MSVYKPAESRFWQYDFRAKGRRFHGSTGVETRRKAEAVERRLRDQAALGQLGGAGDLTLDQAAGRWWLEIGKDLLTADDVERRLGICIRLIGKDIPLAEITTARVSTAIQRRRRETFTKSKRKGAKAYPVSNATVNADIVGVLRRIVRTARISWEVKGLPEINWKALTLAQPAPAIRVYTAEQQAGWLDQCDPTARFALHLLLTYGIRLNELFFPPKDYDHSGPRLVLHMRKGDVPHTVPLNEGDAKQIAARAASAILADLPSIWFEEGAKGKLEPVTYYGIQTRLRTAAKRAGLTMGRVIHGARHHAATTILRDSKNLKVTQQLLGHKDIKSTLVYAHALEDDVRNALVSVSRNSPEGAKVAPDFIPIKQRRKK